MSFTVHFVFHPIACVLLLVTPDIGSFALNLIYLELSLIDRSICKGQIAEAMSLVVSPRTNILCSVRVRICSSPIRFIIKPVSLVNVTVCKVLFAFSICFTSQPLTLVERSVKPPLFALVMFLLVELFVSYDYHRSLGLVFFVL